MLTLRWALPNVSGRSNVTAAPSEDSTSNGQTNGRSVCMVCLWVCVLSPTTLCPLAQLVRQPTVSPANDPSAPVKLPCDQRLPCVYFPCAQSEILPVYNHRTPVLGQAHCQGHPCREPMCEFKRTHLCSCTHVRVETKGNMWQCFIPFIILDHCGNCSSQSLEHLPTSTFCWVGLRIVARRKAQFSPTQVPEGLSQRTDKLNIIINC